MSLYSKQAFNEPFSIKHLVIQKSMTSPLQFFTFKITTVSGKQFVCNVNC